MIFFYFQRWKDICESNDLKGPDADVALAKMAVNDQRSFQDEDWTQLTMKTVFHSLVPVLEVFPYVQVMQITFNIFLYFFNF